MAGTESGFEWDEDKRLSNIAKHDIDFGDAVGIFDGRPTVTKKTDYTGEERFSTISKLDHRTIAVIWTQRGRSRRIISVRRARKNEITLLLEKSAHQAGDT